MNSKPQLSTRGKRVGWGARLHYSWDSTLWLRGTVGEPGARETQGPGQRPLWENFGMGSGRWGQDHRRPHLASASRSSTRLLAPRALCLACVPDQLHPRAPQGLESGGAAAGVGGAPECLASDPRDRLAWAGLGGDSAAGGGRPALLAPPPRLPELCLYLPIPDQPTRHPCSSPLPTPLLSPFFPPLPPPLGGGASPLPTRQTML